MENTPHRIIRPEDFGAVADGVHDDTVAIQCAIDALNAEPPKAPDTPNET